MATYILPQVLVFQEFELAAEVDSQPLNAFVFGGHAHLSRYSAASEKAAAFIGTYDNIGTLVDGDYKTCVSWPGKPVGSTIDPTYTKLFIDNALLQYYATASSIEKVAANKLKLGVNVITNPDKPSLHPHNTAFKDRGVKIGDAIKVVGTNIDDDEVTLYSYVKGFAATNTAADVGDAEAYSTNHDEQTLSTANSAGSDNSGDATINSVSAASYDGHADGDIDEVYTITVTQASTGGDATTAKLRVTTASGRDDVVSVTPAAFGSSTSIGTRGLTVTWSNSSTEFTLGDTWTVTVHQAYAPSTATSGGTYVGTIDRDYIVEVTTGGETDSGDVKITVTSTDGTDFSGPTTVTGLGDSIAVGTKGVTVTFSGSDTALVKGTRFLISATAAAPGDYNIIVLGHNIDSDVDDNFEVTLYIKKNIEVSEKHVAISGNYNWEQSDTEFCVFAGIQAFDDSYTDDGELVALDVVTESGWAGTNKMYLEYRAWRSDLASSVYSINDVANLDTQISGDLTPDNELKWGVYKALQNSNGQDVKYTAVANPADSASWVDVLDLVEERTDVYGFVPLTRDATVLGLVKAHVVAQSTETAGRWRVAWFNTAIESSVAVVTSANSEDNEDVLATTADDSETSGTQYTILTVPANNALFETNGVRAGDTVRYMYESDAYGDSTYSEYVIDEVINESTLRLVTGTESAQPVARKMEVWRTLTLQEQAEAVASASGNWASARVRAIWPDRFEGDGVTQEGYFLCAILAGLASGVVPQQGLTNLEITGVTAVDRTTALFNRSQLDTIAANGGWIVTQDPRSGEVYTRHAVTTGDYENINVREEMVIRNVDSTSYYFQDKFAPYIGISNATPAMLDIIEAETNSAIQFLRTANFTQRLGGQLIDATITDLRISPVFKDRILLALDCTYPYALNNIEIHLMI